jgi:glutathione synthase/RimK-type ligase-like ATP-grasp enzyme
VLLAIVAQRRTATNVALAAAAPWGVEARILSPEQAASLVHPGAVALGRLDVSDTFDGVEDGLWALGSLAARRVRVLNRAGALLAAHDKLLTARVLSCAGLPHPRSRVHHPDSTFPDWEGPLVVKPRFGSWGREIELCDTELASAAI